MQVVELPPRHHAVALEEVQLAILTAYLATLMRLLDPAAAYRASGVHQVLNTRHDRGERAVHSPAARYAKRINSTSEATARTIPAISKWFSDSRNTTTPIVVSSRIMETE